MTNVVKIQEQNSRTFKVIIPVKMFKKIKFEKGMEVAAFAMDYGILYARRYRCGKCEKFHKSGSKIFRDHVKFAVW